MQTQHTGGSGVTLLFRQCAARLKLRQFANTETDEFVPTSLAPLLS